MCSGMLQLHEFLILALIGGMSSASRCGRSFPREEHLHVRWVWWAVWIYQEIKKNSASVGYRTLTSCCTICSM